MGKSANFLIQVKFANYRTKNSGMNVVITGASRGLGKAMADGFAALGNNLYLSSQHDLPLYKAVEDLMLKYPSALIKARPFDLSISGQAHALGQWILDSGIVPDILINNAGQFLPGSVYQEKEGTLEKLIEVNLYSAYHLTRTLLPPMMKQKRGHIFNICSIASLQAYPNGGSYSISKFALAGFSKNLREEMKPYGIRVTAVYPGAAYTDSWAATGIDKKRFMEAEDIAQMVIASAKLSPQACVEDIILRPQGGDIE
jgi:short-subunit dehydrogenase